MATNYIAPTWRMPENTNKDKLSNYSLALDGESEYVTFPLTNFKGDDGTVSYSFWAKPNTYGGSTNYGYFLSASTRGGISYSEGGLSTGLVPGEIYLYDMTNTGVVVTTTGCILDENTWNHIVIVFNTGNIVQFYKNNSLVNTLTGITSYVSTWNTIGRWTANNAHYLNGALSLFSIFDYAVSQEQVSYLYNLNNPMAITGKKPVAYWSFGDNSNPIRTQGYPNLAVEGNVFNFNGSTQAIDCGSGSKFNIDQITISSWVKFNSVSPVLQIIGGIRNTSNGLMPYLLSAQNNSGTKFRFLINQSSDNTYKIIYSNDDIVANTWYHVVGIADGSNIKMYVNGFLQTDQTAYDGTITSPTQNFNIGRQPSNPLYYLGGQLSNISVFNTGLQESDVETLYNNGAPGDISSLSPLGWWKLNGIEDILNGSSWTIKDYGSGSNNGTSVGIMTSANLVQSNLNSTTPYSNYSIKFNGSTQYFGDGDLNGGVFNGATSLSISQWMTIDPGETTSIGAANWEGSGKYQYLTRWRSASGGFDFYLRVSAVSTFARFTTTITPGAWYHVVGTWDGSNTRIYVNGVAGTPMTAAGTLDVSTGENFIGKYLNNRADGLMSNFAYWYNKELTQQEVLEVYNNGVTTNLNNFSGGAPTRWYPMDGKSTYFNGSTLTIRDVINNVDMLGYNIIQTSIEGNAPGSNTNGTGNNLDISNLKGDMSNSIKNSYSINMADYGDPNGQGLTPANSGRTTDVPGSVDPGGQFSPFNTSTTPRSFEGDACVDNNDGEFYTQEFPPQPVIPFVGAIVYTDAAGTGYPEQGYYSQFIEEYNIKVYYLIGANGEVTDSNMCI